MVSDGDNHHSSVLEGEATSALPTPCNRQHPSATTGLENGKCRICGGTGHNEADCFELPKKNKSLKNKSLRPNGWTSKMQKEMGSDSACPLCSPDTTQMDDQDEGSSHACVRNAGLFSNLGSIYGCLVEGYGDVFTLDKSEPNEDLNTCLVSADLYRRFHSTFLLSNVSIQDSFVSIVPAYEKPRKLGVEGEVPIRKLNRYQKLEFEFNTVLLGAVDDKGHNLNLSEVNK